MEEREGMERIGNQKTDVEAWDLHRLPRECSSAMENDGNMKGMLLTHHNRLENGEDVPRPVSLPTLPPFHVFGFFMIMRAVSLAETLVLLERFGSENMLKAV